MRGLCFGPLALKRKLRGDLVWRKLDNKPHEYHYWNRRSYKMLGILLCPYVGPLRSRMLSKIFRLQLLSLKGNNFFVLLHFISCSLNNESLKNKVQSDWDEGKYILLCASLILIVCKEIVELKCLFPKKN